MPRIKTGQTIETSPRQQSITARIKSGKLVPILSHAAVNDLLLGGHETFIDDYATYLEHQPLNNQPNLPQMTQFKSVLRGHARDPLMIKKDYLTFAKSRLYDLAKAAGVPSGLLTELDEAFDTIPLSDFPARLGFPSLDDPSTNPLLHLTDFDIPIYLTTSYHNCLEMALERAGKRPRTEICRWNQLVESQTSVFDGHYEPTANEPLVYHLYGFDTIPESLVLTEDDHLQFLVALSRGRGTQTDPVPGLTPARKLRWRGARLSPRFSRATPLAAARSRKQPPSARQSRDPIAP